MPLLEFLYETIVCETQPYIKELITYISFTYVLLIHQIINVFFPIHHEIHINILIFYHRQV